MGLLRTQERYACVKFVPMEYRQQIEYMEIVITIYANAAQWDAGFNYSTLSMLLKGFQKLRMHYLLTGSS